MSSLLELLTDQLNDQNLGRMSKRIGAGEGQTERAVSFALPVLIEALARNASTSEGANSLSRALAEDHDGSVLDNITDIIDTPENGPGDGILRHMFGSRRTRVENGLSQTSGLDIGQISKILITLAPIVMGALGKAKRQQNLDDVSITDYLGKEKRNLEQENPNGMNILGALFDTDGDGDVDISDIAKHGISILGKYMRR